MVAHHLHHDSLLTLEVTLLEILETSHHTIDGFEVWV
jgi:hypothetical protein